MRVLVMGAGAVGSVVGGLLCRAGHDVALIGRAPHMDAIARDGLQITGIWGDYRITGLRSATLPEAAPRWVYDAILLCTKAYDTAAALTAALPLAGPDTLVVSLQNGLGNAETIAARVGVARAVAGRVIFGAELVQDGAVRVTVFGGDVLLGFPDGAMPSPALTRLTGALADAGVPTQATPDIMGYVWGKVLYNSCLNPLSALLDVPYGVLAEHEAARAIMRDVIAEAFAVAAAEEVVMLWDGPAAYERLLFDVLVPPTAAHYASMWSDLRRGRRTEIDALNGALARLGERHGLPTPANTLLTRLVHAREARALVSDIQR
jgi:2-dehydropantoate 2-reductase